MTAHTVGSGGEFATWAAVSWVSGDTYDGQGQVFSEQITVTADNVTVKNFVVNGNNAVNYGLYANAVSGLTVTDFEVYATLKGGVLIENDTAGTTKTGITVQRGKIHDILPGGLSGSTEALLRVGVGLCIGSGPTSGTSLINGVLIEDVEIHDCGRHGIDVRWRVLNVLRRRCKVWSCGSQAGGHGITSHPMASSFTGGWTLVSGNVYSRARVSSNDNEQMLTNATNGVVLTRNTTTPTTPGLNEWGVSAPNIYVNIGGDPATKNFRLKRNAHGPFVDDGHQTWGISQYGGTEGHGLSYDDQSGPAYMHGCKSWENGGAGFYAYGSEAITRCGSISQGNGLMGFGAVNTDSVVDVGVLAKGNKGRGIQHTGGKSSVLRNSIAVGNDSVGLIGSAGGLFIGGGQTGQVTSNNYTYANGVSETSGVTATTADPLLNPDGTLQPGSPCIGAGKALDIPILAYDGRPFSVPPSIGAFEFRQIQTRAQVFNRSQVFNRAQR